MHGGWIRSHPTPHATRSQASRSRPMPAAVAGARYDVEDEGLQTRRARTRATWPLVRISSRFDDPTHHGLPTCHPVVRLSKEPRSGPSSSSGAAGRHDVHRPANERVRNTTVPVPRQCRPTRVKRCACASELGDRSGAGMRSTVATEATPATEVAGSTAPAVSMRKRTSRRRICGQSCSHTVRAQAADPCVDAILTA